MEDLINSKENYDEKRLKVAKIAYQLMKYTIDKIQNMEPIEIDCGWDGTITVDGKMFFENEIK